MSEGGTAAYFCRAVLLSLREGPRGRGEWEEMSVFR